MPEAPRRRRPSSPSSRRSSGSSILPTIALGIGVVVAGLGIGAFLSSMQTKGTTTRTASRIPAPVVTPVPQPPRRPVAVATLVAHPTPTPIRTPKPSPSPSAEPTVTPEATAKPTPAQTAKAVARVTAAPSAEPTAKAVATEAPTEKPTATPTRRPTPVRATPRPAEVAAAPVQTAPGFGGTAQTAVRRYLDALMAGNENGAYAALGKAPGDAGAELSEEAFIDRSTRVTSMRTTSVDATGATVEAEIRSDRGTYYATYHVTNGPSGPVIDQHDYIKV
jgi:outer membrane biosynthesis protein TonB